MSSTARRRSAAARCVVVAALVAGCHAEVAPSAPEATLAIAVTVDESAAPADALLYVDGLLAGRAADTARAPLGLHAGRHRVELRGGGKLAAYRDVTLRPGDALRLAVRLHDDLDAVDAATLAATTHAP